MYKFLQHDYIITFLTCKLGHGEKRIISVPQLLNGMIGKDPQHPSALILGWSLYFEFLLQLFIANVKLVRNIPCIAKMRIDTYMHHVLL